MFPDPVTILLEPDQVLLEIRMAYGILIYRIIFLLIFCETGFVIAAPFFPGDTLLFIAGILTAAGMPDLFAVITTISLGAITGDSLNYHFGKYAGNRFLSGTGTRLIQPKWLEKNLGSFRFDPMVRS